MPAAPSVAPGFFPLDEELQLLPGHLTPSLVESVVRLSTWMPFLPAAKMVGAFTKVDLSAPTARRLTERAGQAYVEIQTAQVDALERKLPASPAGPPVQQVSVDGAMVPLRHKEWAEVKTLVIGTVTRREEGKVHATELSYFSRLTDAESFTRLATVETHRRGTEKAGQVCAVADGADWEQGFFDVQCPGAVRILDWGHAAAYVVKAAQAVFGAGTAATSQWLETQLYELRHGDPQTVLKALRTLLGAGTAPAEETTGEEAPLSEEVRAVVAGSLAYLEKRQEQIQYATFAAQGYPIGSGAVESANKLVVEARLKGSGMHWERAHVDPMLALRTIACSDRWEEDWSQVATRLRDQVAEWATAHRRERKATPARQILLPQKEGGPVEALAPTMAQREQKPDAPRAKPSLTTAKPVMPAGDRRRPPATHPWRHTPIGRSIWRHRQPAAEN